MTEPSVTVTIARLGAGESTVELEPGETLEEAFDGPGYVQVEVAEGSGDGDTVVVVPDSSTTEQDEKATSTRMDTEKKRSCGGCGDVYPAAYSRCPGCGNPNPDA